MHPAREPGRWRETRKSSGASRNKTSADSGPSRAKFCDRQREPWATRENCFTPPAHWRSKKTSMFYVNSSPATPDFDWSESNGGFLGETKVMDFTLPSWRGYRDTIDLSLKHCPPAV